MLLSARSGLLPNIGASGVVYSLRDLFTTARAAGAVNGTAAEPGGLGAPTRVVTDAENLISIGGGKAIFAGGKATPAYGDPRLQPIGSITRAAGLIIAWEFNANLLTGKIIDFGVDSDTSSTVYNGFAPNGVTDLRVRHAGNLLAADKAISAGVSYIGVVVLRSTGADFLIKGGVYTDFTIIYRTPTGNQATMYPVLSNYSGGYTGGWMINPASKWLPVPQISHGFSALTPTDGLGHTDNTGIGAGGSGLTMANRIGTWGAAAGVASASALSGGLAITTTGAVAADGFASVACVRSAGNVGVVARYVNGSNYLRAYHDGTNCVLEQVVAGTPTTLITGVVAYTNGGVVNLLVSGTYARLWYNNAHVGTTDGVDASLIAAEFGLYTTNTSNTLDNFTFFPRGNEGEYTFLSTLMPAVPATKSLFAVGDSKTAGDTWVDLLVGLLSANDPAAWIELTPRFGSPGYTVATTKTYVDANLASVTGTANLITINLGANDVSAMPVEANWKADLTSIINSLRAKWPSATIYIARPWRRSYLTQCNTLATWISDIVTIFNSPYVVVGMDERIWLENGDDGVSLTTDGIHYNTTTGQTAAATAWMTAMGY